MSGIKIIARNKRAGYDFFLEEKYEAGIVLQGTEVKSLRNGKTQINDSYVTIDKAGEAWLYNMHIPQYEYGNIANHAETRKRKLLLNKKEIDYIAKTISQKALTIVLTKVYFKGSNVKIEIALAKGKKLFDKREDKKEKEIQRKMNKGNFDL